jgi:hypothetical protein
MSAAPIVRTVLAADATVSSFLGARIHYTAAPPGEALPLAVIVQTGARDGRSLAGADQFPESTIEVVIRAATFTACQQIGDAVIVALQDAHGIVMGRQTWIAREPVDAFDFVPAEGTHRRIIGFRVKDRIA